MNKKTSDPIIEPSPKRAWAISWVWLIPILALLIALLTVWQTYAGRGPIITVSFADASGIVAGETKLKYRNVDVGLVEEISFSDDLARVLARVRIEPEVAPSSELKGYGLFYGPLMASKSQKEHRSCLKVSRWDG